IGHVKTRRKLERSDARSRNPIELIDVRAIFVRDENAHPVARNPQSLGVETGILGIAGVLIGLEVVGATGKVVLEQIVGGRYSRSHTQPATGAVYERSQAPQQSRIS